MKKISIIHGLFGLLLAISLVTPSAALAGGSLTPTPTPKPTPTPTLKPGAKAVKASALTNLKVELFLGGEGLNGQLRLGILVDCPSWDQLSAKVTQDPQLPYIYNAGRVKDMGQVCVYGLDPAGFLQVDLTRPDGSQVETAQMTTEFLSDTFYQFRQNQPELPHEVGYGDLVNGVPVFSLALWWPAGLPAGKWQIAAYNANGEAAYGEFKLKNFDPQPAIGLTKPRAGAYPPNTSPFLRSNVSADCTQILAGHPFTVYVVNVPPSTDFSLGLYFNDANTARLIKSYPATSNKKGNQKIDMQLNDDLEAGIYYLLLPTNGNARSFWDSGANTCVELIK
jgi:hypothetical protein